MSNTNLPSSIWPFVDPLRGDYNQSKCRYMFKLRRPLSEMDVELKVVPDRILTMIAGLLK